MHSLQSVWVVDNVLCGIFKTVLVIAFLLCTFDFAILLVFPFLFLKLGNYHLCGLMDNFLIPSLDSKQDINKQVYTGETF